MPIQESVPTPESHFPNDEKYWESRQTIETTRDIAGELPPVLHAKLIRIRDDSKKATAFASVIHAEMQTVREKCQRVETTLLELLHKGYKGTARYKVEEKALDREKDEFKRLQEKYSRCVSVSQSFIGLIPILENYLKAHLASIAVLTSPHAFPLPEGRSPIDALAEKRREIDSLRNQILAAKDAPISSAEAKRLARQWVDELASDGRIDVTSLIARGAMPELPAIGSVEVFSHGAKTDRGIPNAGALLAWINRKALITALEVEIDAHSDDARALSPAARKTKICELKKELLLAQRDEESLFDMSVELGSQIARRTDADPRAILGLSSEMPEPRGMR